MGQIIINSDGKTFHREQEITCSSDREVNIDSALLQTIGNGIPRIAAKLFTYPGLGPVNVCLVNNSGSVFVSVQLGQLKMKATYDAANEITFPTFKGKGEFVTLDWTPVPDMALYFGVKVDKYNPAPGTVPGYFYASTLYLFAIHTPSKTCHLLPMPNLYNDCHVCVGDYNSKTATTFDSFLKAYEYFCASKWNDHLIKDNSDRMKCAAKMFRFKPNGPETFESLPPEDDWRKLCVPVGTDVLNWLGL